MLRPAIPEGEVLRLAALWQCRVLDTAPERGYDDVVALAGELCGAPIALVSLVDHSRQWFKACVGLDVAQTGRDESFCAHAILQPADTLVVEDTLRDLRFADNPLVTGPPHIRFYAGVPVLAGGQPVGTVCVIDRRPRCLEGWQIAALRTLAGQVGRMLDRGRTQPPSGGEDGWGRLLDIAASGLELAALLSPDHRYLWVNARYRDYWARGGQSLAGRAIIDVVGPVNFERVRPLLDRARDGAVTVAEVDIAYAGRGPRHVLLHAEAARTDDGAVLGVLMRIHDIQPFMERISALSGRVEALERTALQQERLLQILSHDLREPLNAVRNFSTLALEAGAGAASDDVRRYLAFVRQAGERLAARIDDLTTYLRSAEDRAEEVEVSLAGAALEAWNGLAEAAQRSAARLDLAGGLPLLRADPARLRALLHHLLANAIAHGRDGVAPQIRIDAERLPRAWALHIADDGPGIPDDAREAVFDLFRRLSRGRPTAGNGLGLALCRRIVEQRGGRIGVGPGRDGSGSRFTIVWPDEPPAEG